LIGRRGGRKIRFLRPSRGSSDNCSVYVRWFTKLLLYIGVNFALRRLWTLLWSVRWQRLIWGRFNLVRHLQLRLSSQELLCLCTTSFGWYCWGESVLCSRCSLFKWLLCCVLVQFMKFWITCAVWISTSRNCGRIDHQKIKWVILLLWGYLTAVDYSVLMWFLFIFCYSLKCAICSSQRHI
jgi:hypothetical protein